MLAPRKLGLFMLTALVTGNMIGSGIFMLPASLAGIGTISLYSWIFTAAGALLMAFIFSQMAALYPHKTGGPYLYTAEAFGPFVGAQTAYCYWAAAWIGNTATALAAMSYLGYFFPWLQVSEHACGAAIATIWFFTFINILSVHHAGKFQIIATTLKLLPIIMIGTVGWLYYHPEFYAQSFNVTGGSDWSAFAAASTLTLWAFLGLESGTVPAGITHNPKRNIPLATLLGTSIAIIVYISSSAALMGMIPAAALSQSTFPFADAARIILGPIGGGVIAAGACISALGTLNGWILIQGQVAESAAEQGYFPAFFKSCGKALHTPVRALLISSSLMTLLLLMSTAPSLIQQFNIVILMATLASLFPYFYTSMAYVILLKKQHKKLGFWPAIGAILAGCYALWMIYGAGTEVVFYGTLLVLTSVPIYTVCVLQGGKKSRDD